MMKKKVQFNGQSNGDAIGSAVTIVNLVTAEINNDHHKLASGDDVHQQELIEAAKDVYRLYGDIFRDLADSATARHAA